MEVLHNLRSAGLVALYDLNIAPGAASFPVSRLHQFVGRCVSEMLVRGTDRDGDGLEAAPGHDGCEVDVSAAALRGADWWRQRMCGIVCALRAERSGV